MDRFLWPCYIFLVLRFDFSCLINTFLISAHQIIFKNKYLLLLTPLLFFRHAPIHHTIVKPGERRKFFFYSYILRVPFFVPIIPLNKFMIITILIVITSYFYLFFGNKPIRDIFQIEKASPHCIVTHILHLKVIRDIFQQPYGYFKGPDTHFLCFKLVRHKSQSPWIFATVFLFFFFLLLLFFCFFFYDVF